MRIEEVVKIVIVATTTFIVVTTIFIVATMTMTKDWQSRLDVVATMVATMTPCFQHKMTN